MFPVYHSNVTTVIYLFFYIVFVVIHFRQPHLKLKCQTASVLSNSRLMVWCGLLRFTPNSSSQVWLIISPLLTWHISLADSIETGYRKWLFFSLCVCWGCKWEESFLGGFWRLFGQPEIKLSAAGPVLHCWEEHRGPNEMHVSSIKGAGCVSSSLT